MMKSTAMGAITVMMLMLLKSTSAETLTVGDDFGWKVPPSSDFYSSWASKHTFAVDDTLEFNFVNGSHTVAMVTSKEAYDNCDSKTAKLYKTSPAKITLTNEGNVFFFCTVGPHCINGQKVSVNVGSSGPASNIDLSPPKPPTGQEKGSAPTPIAHLTLSTIFSLCFVSLVMALGYY